MPPSNAQVVMKQQAYKPVDCPNGCPKEANQVVTESKDFQFAMCGQCRRLLAIFTTDVEPQVKMMKIRG